MLPEQLWLSGQPGFSAAGIAHTGGVSQQYTHRLVHLRGLGSVAIP